MHVEGAVITGVVVAAATATAATPAAIRMAALTGFYDHPREYRQHARATPFLGGAAVLVAFLAAAAAVGVSGREWALLGCASALWAIGTLDDRLDVAPKWRLLAEAGAAGAVFAAGLGWRLPIPGPFNLALSVVWCVALVNAFNLMDNEDGACASVAAASALGIGGLAALHRAPLLAGMAFALAGACLVFLRWNLASPSRIFLGDGGSMPIGFVLAVLGMATSRHIHHGGAALLVVGMIAGVVVLDTSLVSVSRLRRGVSLLTGGRDHLTHRLLARLGSARAVAAALLLAQLTLAAIALGTDRLGVDWIYGAAAGTIAGGLLAIAVLDSPSWRTPKAARAQREHPDARRGVVVPVGQSLVGGAPPLMRPSFETSSADRP